MPLRRHIHLAAFLLASAGVHVLVVVAINVAASVPPIHLGQQVLDAELASIPRPAPRRQTGSRASSADNRQPVQAVAESVLPGIGLGDNDVSTSSSDAEITGLRNQLLGELRTRLSEYLTYPALARSRGWEGMVVLGLRVESDGRLDHLRVEQGSGYAVLDDSALDSLHRIGRLTGVVDRIGRPGIDLRLPIIYRLAQN